MLVALAQESRLHIVRILQRASPGGLAAGRIAETTACAASTISFHLNHLEKAGLVRSQRQGQSIVYFAVPEALSRLTGFLAAGAGAALGRPAPRRGRTTGKAVREPEPAAG